MHSYINGGGEERLCANCNLPATASAHYANEVADGNALEHDADRSNAFAEELTRIRKDIV